MVFFFFFQAEDGIRDRLVTGVQTCALPIFPPGVEVTSHVEVPDRVQVPDRVRYSDHEATMAEMAGQKQAQAPIGIVEKSEIAGGAVPQPGVDLGAIATTLSAARDRKSTL